MKILPVVNYQTRNQNNNKQNVNFEAFKVDSGETLEKISHLCSRFGIKYDYNKKIGFYVLDDESNIAWEKYLKSPDEGMKYTAWVVEHAKSITYDIAKKIWDDILNLSNEEASKIVKGHLASGEIADL